MEQEPVFLTREQIDTIHRDQLDAWGGLHGIRSEGGLESAIARPLNVHFYGNCDLYEIAPAYAYHLAESRAYFDGNKRTAVQAALDFLEINGVDTLAGAGNLRSHDRAGEARDESSRPGGVLPRNIEAEHLKSQAGIAAPSLVCRTMELHAVYMKVPEGHVAFIEQLPGANTGGGMFEETRANVREAVALVLSGVPSMFVTA